MPIPIKVKYVQKTIPINQTVAGAIVPVGRKIDDLAPKVAKNSDDVLGALRKTIEIEDLAKEGKILAQAGIDTGNSAIKKADDIAAKAAGNAAKIAGVLDRIGNIFNLIATLGTAARMEFIRNELLNKIDVNSRDIDVLENQIYNAIQDIVANSQSIEDLEAQLSNLANSLEFIKNQNRGILTNTSSLLSGQNSISSKQDSMSSRINLIKEDTEVIRDVVPQIDDNVISAIKQKVCEALNSDCWENINGGDEVDLSSIEQALNDIGSSLNDVLEQLGFPFNCQTNFISNGQYDSVAEALFSVVCRGGSGGNNAIEEILEEKDRTDEILDKLDDIKCNETFHITAFEEIADRTSGTYLSFKTMDANAENFPRATSSDTRYPYVLPNSRADLTVEDLAAITFEKGNTYCWIEPKGIKINGRLFKAYFASEASGYATLDALYNLTEYGRSTVDENDVENPSTPSRKGTSKISGDSSKKQITTKIVQAVIYNSDTDEIVKSFSSCDFLEYYQGLESEEPNNDSP